MCMNLLFQQPTRKGRETFVRILWRRDNKKTLTLKKKKKKAGLSNLLYITILVVYMTNYVYIFLIFMLLK